MTNLSHVSVAISRQLKMSALLLPPVVLFVACRADVSAPNERPSFQIDHIIATVVGDKDQEHFAGTSEDGHGVIHETDDLPGFDMRMVGGTVDYSFDISNDADDTSLLQFTNIVSVKLDIAIVGFIDGDPGFSGDQIDNKLYVDGVEVRFAFDDSGADGWELFTFDLDPSVVTDGVLNVSVEASDLEGWGGIDYSELKVTGEVDPLVRLVEIDIKTGSDPNSIDCNNDNGTIAVAVLTTDDFDATTVDHTTVTFESASETHVVKKTGEPRRHEEDVDGDGDTDLVLHFRLGDTDLTCGSTEGMLTGQTFNGTAIEGTDAVRMIDQGAGKQ